MIFLDEIILEAQDDYTYHTALKYGSQLPVSGVVSRNAIILLDEIGLTFKIISTLPVLKGLICESTRIVITHPGDISEPIKSEIIYEDIMTSMSWSLTGEISYPLSCMWNDCKFVRLIHKVEALVDYDDYCTVFCSLKDMIRMGICQNQLIQLANGNNYSRIVRVCEIYPNEISKNDHITLHVSPILYNNLELNRTGSSLKYKLSGPDEIKIESLPIASEVYLARISGHLLNDKKIFEEAILQLRKLLDIPNRLFKVGDIIEIIINEEVSIMRSKIMDDVDSSNFLSFPQTKNSTVGIVYFKIVNFKTDTKSNFDTFIINQKNTKLVQSGVESSHIPIGNQVYHGLKNVNIQPKNDSLSFNTILNLIRAVDNNPRCLFPLRILIHGKGGTGKTTMINSIADFLGMNLFHINIVDIMQDTLANSKAYISAKLHNALSIHSLILVLDQIDFLKVDSKSDFSIISTAFQEIISLIDDHMKIGLGNVILIATAYELDNLPSDIKEIFEYCFGMEIPSENRRTELLTQSTREISLSYDVNIQNISMKTAGFNPGNITDLLTMAYENSLSRAAKIIKLKYPTMNESELLDAGIIVQNEDISMALDKARTELSDSIGAPKIPSVQWEDIGGLQHVKDAILETLQLPLDHPELFSSGIKKRSGVLLYGPPGTGKTMVAKAVATTLSLNFLSVKGPELLNMYVGESEANVRKVFQRARDARPCIIFFDELDSVAPKRGDKADSGGVMDRITSQLLAELDGMGGNGDVFVIGATNRPDLLDSALLRPGRFDKLLYLGVCEDMESQVNVLTALTRKFTLHGDVSFDDIAKLCTFQYTGADFYALCTDALMKAVMRSIKHINDKLDKLNSLNNTTITCEYFIENMLSDDERKTIVKKEDFIGALKEMVPSVSANELKRYEEIQKKFM